MPLIHDSVSGATWYDADASKYAGSTRYTVSADAAGGTQTGIGYDPQVGQQQWALDYALRSGTAAGQQATNQYGAETQRYGAQTNRALGAGDLYSKLFGLPENYAATANLLRGAPNASPVNFWGALQGLAPLGQSPNFGAMKTLDANKTVAGFFGAGGGGGGGSSGVYGSSGSGGSGGGGGSSGGSGGGHPGQSEWEARRDAWLGGQSHDAFQMAHATTSQELNDIVKAKNRAAFEALKQRAAWTPETSHGSNWRAAGNGGRNPYRDNAGAQVSFDYNGPAEQAFHQPRDRSGQNQQNRSAEDRRQQNLRDNRGEGLTAEQQQNKSTNTAKKKGTFISKAYAQGGTEVVPGGPFAVLRGGAPPMPNRDPSRAITEPAWTNPHPDPTNPLWGTRIAEWPGEGPVAGRTFVATDPLHFRVGPQPFVVGERSRDELVNIGPAAGGGTRVTVAPLQNPAVPVPAYAASLANDLVPGSPYRPTPLGPLGGQPFIGLPPTPPVAPMGYDAYSGPPIPDARYTLPALDADPGGTQADVPRGAYIPHIPGMPAVPGVGRGYTPITLNSYTGPPIPDTRYTLPQLGGAGGSAHGGWTGQFPPEYGVAPLSPIGTVPLTPLPPHPMAMGGDVRVPPIALAMGGAVGVPPPSVGFGGIRALPPMHFAGGGATTVAQDPGGFTGSGTLPPGWYISEATGRAVFDGALWTQQTGLPPAPPPTVVPAPPPYGVPGTPAEPIPTAPFAPPPAQPIPNANGSGALPYYPPARPIGMAGGGQATVYGTPQQPAVLYGNTTPTYATSTPNAAGQVTAPRSHGGGTTTIPYYEGTGYADPTTADPRTVRRLTPMELSLLDSTSRAKTGLDLNMWSALFRNSLPSWQQASTQSAWTRAS